MIDLFCDAIDQENDGLGTRVSGSGFGAEDKTCGGKVLNRTVFQTVIKCDDGKGIE